MTKNNLSKILLSFISFFVLSFLVLGRTTSSIGSIGKTTENSSVIYDGENSYSSVEEYQRVNKQNTVTKQNSSNNNVEPLTTVDTDHETEHPGGDWTILNGQTSLSSGNYYLEGDLSSSQITIASGSDVSLCLAGFTITSSSRYFIYINNNVSGSETSFTLYDCSENQDGLICFSSYRQGVNATYPIYARNYSSNSYFSITINGGTLESYSSSYSAYGIYATNYSYSDSSFDITINGGKINVSNETSLTAALYLNNYAQNSSFNLTINGGEVSCSSTDSSAYGVYALNQRYNSSSTIIINGGTISSSSTSTEYRSCGLDLYNSAQECSFDVTINEGEIYCSTTCATYAVRATNEASSSWMIFNINGGRISSLADTTDYISCSLELYSSAQECSYDVTINGGEISCFNTGTSYGIRARSEAASCATTFTINDGTIYSSSASTPRQSNGLYIQDSASSCSSVFKMYGGTIFSYAYSSAGAYGLRYLSEATYCSMIITIEGGEIYSYSQNSSAWGIYSEVDQLYCSVIITMNGGKITSLAYLNSYGIFCRNGGLSVDAYISGYLVYSITINGGEIYSSTNYDIPEDNLRYTAFGIHLHDSLSTLTINEGTITALNGYGIYLNAYGHNYASPSITMNGGTIRASYIGIYIYKYGNTSPSLTINGGEIWGNDCAIYCDVSALALGEYTNSLNITINGGEVSGGTFEIVSDVTNTAVVINGGYVDFTYLVLSLTNPVSFNFIINAGYFTNEAYVAVKNYIPDTSIMINFDESELDASLDPYYTSDYPYAVYVKGDTYQYMLDGTTICYDGTTYYQDYLEALLGDKVTYSYTDGTNTVDNALPSEVGNYSVTARFNEPRINYEVTPKEYYEGAITFNLNIVNHDYNSGSYQSNDTQHWSQCVNSLNGGICHEDTYYEEHEFSGWVESEELEDTEESACTICGYTKTRSAEEGSTDPDDPSDPTDSENPTDPDDPDDSGVSTDPNDQDSPNDPDDSENPTGTGQGGEAPGSGSIDSTASTLFILHIIYITVAVICLIAGYIAKRNADKDNELEAENNDVTA